MSRCTFNTGLSVLGLGLITILSLPDGASCSSVVPLDLHELTRLSDAIVHGTVVSTASRWNADRTAIVTEVRLRVHESIKGDSGENLVFVHPGGVVGALRVEIAGVPGFEEGQETVVFVSETEGGVRQVTGLTQGRFDVEAEAKGNGPAGGKFVRLGVQASSKVTADGDAQTSNPQPSDRALARSKESLEGFLDRVRRIVEEIENEDEQ